MELSGDHLARQLREGVVKLGQQRVLFVDRRVLRIPASERYADQGLGGRPHDLFKADGGGRGEHVVRAHHVDPECLAVGEDVWGRNGGEVDDGVGAAEHLDGLAEVGEIGDHRRSVWVTGGGDVYVDHPIPVLT